MNKIIPLLLAATLVACGKSEPTATTSASGQIETVESLAANPQRLKELRQQCKTDRAKLGDELCNRVAEATNRRFLGDGKTPYTPPKEQPKF
ncbi:EexN family lipoprotein [Enterobacter roggenkampii]